MGTCNLRSSDIFTPVYISQIAHVEVVAALRRTGRREGLHRSFIDTMVNIFERHIAASTAQHSPIYHITPLLPGIENLAVHLCNKYWTLDPYPLRSLDAIQLASAIFVAALVRGPLMLVAADTRLGTIAQLEGVQVINPIYPPPSTPT